MFFVCISLMTVAGEEDGSDKSWGSIGEECSVGVGEPKPSGAGIFVVITIGGRAWKKYR